MCMSVVNLVFVSKMTLPLLSHGLSPPESAQIRINSTEKFDNQIQVGVLIKSREGRSIFGTILTVRAIFFYHRKNSPPVALVCQMMRGGNFEWELILIFLSWDVGRPILATGLTIGIFSLSS